MVKMKLFTGGALILLVAAISVAALCAAGSSDEELRAAAAAAGGPKKGKISQILSNFRLPKIFNFDKYKRVHSKEYPSHSEDLARSKNYFGRAFKVFISGVQYLWKRSPKYLTITEKADWTQAERDASFTYNVEHSTLHEHLKQQAQLNGAGMDHPIEPLSGQDDGDDDENPAVELEEVEETLAEIVSKRGENAAFAKIAAELVSADSSRRKKRDTEGVEEQEARRQVSLDDLLMKNSTDDQSELEPLEKLTYSIESNNPDYEQVEVFSEGVDDDSSSSKRKKRREMSRSERSKTLARKGKSYLTKVVSGAFRPFSMVTDFWNAQNKDKPDHSLPNEVFIDYRQSGCIYHPKSQRECGSCYIFSSTALFEYHQCKQSGKLVPFSEQYIVDCGGRIKMSGCDGGWETQVGDFVEQYGLEQQHDYPYRGQATECPYSSETPNRFMGHTKARQAKMKLLGFKDMNNRDVIRQTLEKYGPLVISIHTNDEILDYGGGVDMMNNCRWAAGHSMLIVGHGRQDGLEYWLIRNSWGYNWGERGYYKLSKGIAVRCMMTIGYVDPKFDQAQAATSAAARKNSRRKRLHNKQRIAMFLENFGV